MQTSKTGDGPELDPICLGERSARLSRLEHLDQCRDRKAIGKAVAATGLLVQFPPLELGPRIAEQSRRRAGLLHAQAQIAGGDQDAGAEQDALATALRRGRPHSFQYLLRLKEIAAIVERDAIAQRGMT